MDNKKLGLVLIGICVIFGFLVFMFNSALSEHAEGSCECEAMISGGTCPMDTGIPWQTYLGIILVAGLAALGIYLVFFEKSQKAIISALEDHKKDIAGIQAEFKEVFKEFSLYESMVEHNPDPKSYKEAVINSLKKLWEVCLLVKDTD